MSRKGVQAPVAVISPQTSRYIAANLLQSLVSSVVRTADWAVDTAQQFGALVSALMGPAIVSAYAFTLWSLAGNLGWTDSFVFAHGPLSNWMLWLGLALSVNFAANILRRHTDSQA